MQKSIVIRADAAPSQGIGHVKRCAALAEGLQAFGDLTFVCRWISAELEAELHAKGMPVARISSESPPTDVVGWLRANWRRDVEECRKALATRGIGDSDLLIVDHYGLDGHWEHGMRAATKTILVLDDLADRGHDCDLLVDQTLGRVTGDYANLVPKGCRILCGSQYALLPHAFFGLRSQAEFRRRAMERVSRVLVSFGGTDPGNLSSAALDAIAVLPFRRQLKVDVLLTSAAPHLAAVAAKVSAQDYDAALIVDETEVAQRILDADAAIGAGGTSTWERAVLGLPTIMVVAADNQQKVAGEMAKVGATRLVQSGHQGVSHEIARAAAELWSGDVGALRRMTNAAFDVCDGLGAKRVAEEVRAYYLRGWGHREAARVRLRQATLEDEDVLYMWQGYPGVRRYSRNPAVPRLTEHRAWFRDVVSDDGKRLYIIECNQVPAGMLRLDPIESDCAYEVSVLVSPAFQQRGIAKRALQAAQKIAELRAIRAYVNPANVKSTRLFSSAGFVPQGGDWYVWTRQSESANPGRGG